MVASSAPRRTVILTDDLGGGTGNHILLMVRFRDKDRWETQIASRRPPSSRVVAEVPVEVIPPVTRFSFYPIAQVRTFFRVRRLVKRLAPDLLHTYFFWSIMYGRALKFLGCVRFLVENREDQGFNWGKHEYFLLRATRSLPDRVICVSSAVRDVAVEREGLDPERALVVHNGLDLTENAVEQEPCDRQEVGLTPDCLVVGMVANFDRPIKGVDYFVEAIPAIVRAVPNARFLLLGRGSLEGRLREQARSLGVESYLVFAGFRPDIHRYYPIMDVSVLTSLSEGLSITLLESMMHSLPVVVTRVGGNPDVVVEGETGFLVPPRDVDAFAERVVRLLRDPDLRTRMGQAGRRVVETRFRLEGAAESYLRIYDDVMARGESV